MQSEVVVTDVRHLVTTEVPVGMVDDVYRCGFVMDGGAGFPDEFVVVVEGVGDFAVEGAGVTFFAVI